MTDDKREIKRRSKQRKGGGRRYGDNPIADRKNAYKRANEAAKRIKGSFRVIGRMVAWGDDDVTTTNKISQLYDDFKKAHSKKNKYTMKTNAAQIQYWMKFLSKQI